MTNCDLISQNSTSKISEEYEFNEEQIGIGAYAKVVVGIHKRSQQKRAIKIISLESLSQEQIEQMKVEINILKQVDHPNIVKLYEFFEDKSHIYIIEELCQGGELFEYIQNKQRLSEDEAAEIFLQIMYAINYLHKNNFIHRDVKPENILLFNKDSFHIKLCDFGSSIQINQYEKTIKSGLFGTAYYIAPEVAMQQQYNEKCDIWSCGIILYAMLSGTPPFNGRDSIQVMENVKSSDLSFEAAVWKDISKPAKILISKMLDRDIEKRLTSEQVIQDQWLQKYHNPHVHQTHEPLLKKCLNNLVDFRNLKQLQNLFWSFIVFNFLSNTEKAELEEAFNQLDENKDGKLSKQEILYGLQICYMNAQPLPSLTSIMKYVDQNHNDYIDFSEWLIAATSKVHILKEETLKKAFSMMDLNGNGYLEINELEKCFKIPELADDLKWIKLINSSFKSNKQQVIDYESFKTLMMQLAEQEKYNQTIRMQAYQDLCENLNNFFE